MFYLGTIVHEGYEEEISGYFEDEKSLVLIGDGRKILPVLNRLVKLNGRSNFDWCRVMGA